MSNFQEDNDRHTVMQAAGCLLQAATLLVMLLAVAVTVVILQSVGML